MKKPTDPRDEELMRILINRGWKNLSGWLENICDDYCEYVATETHSSLQRIERQFYTDLHKGFFCTILTLIHKFLIDKGVGHIFKPRPPLHTPSNMNLEKKLKDWERFIQEREWEHFLHKWLLVWPPRVCNSRSGRQWGVCKLWVGSKHDEKFIQEM